MGDSDASCFLGHSDREMETARAWVHGLREGPWREKEAEQWGQPALRCGRSELGKATRGGLLAWLVETRLVCWVARSVKEGRIWGQLFLKCRDFLSSQVEGEICSSTWIFG